MKSLVIFGAGDIAELAHFYFEKDTDHSVAAFVVDDDYAKESQFCGKPLLPRSEMIEKYPASDYGAFVALSYNRMNHLRAERYSELKEQGYYIATYVGSKVTNYASSVGGNCFILEDNTLQPFTKIGNNVTLWSGNHIGHHSTIEDHCFLTSHVVVSGGVHIGAYSFIGVNSTLRDHVKIGKEALIGAGSLIVKDTEPASVYRGTGRAEKQDISSLDVKL